LRGLVVRAQNLEPELDHLLILIVDGKPFLGQPNRWGQRLFQRQSSVVLCEMHECRGRAGNTRRQWPVYRQVFDHMALRIQIHITARSQGRAFAPVDHGFESVARAV
jgi:hypothetical protein